MGVGVSLHKLAGHVSKEGGIGVISTADIGYQEPDFNTNPLAANLRAIGSEIKKAREIAGSDKILGVNVMVALQNYNEKSKITKCYKCIKTCDIKNTPYCITKALINSVKGNLKEGLIFCGSNVDKVKELMTVHDLMEELAGV